MAMGERKAFITREKGTIDGHVSALQAVKNEQRHPNAAWSEAIDRRTTAARAELLKEWTALWESQQPLRAWPQALGPDFLASIAAVESGGRPELQFRDLQRYQNTVPDLVRELPERMGSADMMAGLEGEAGARLGQRPPRPRLGPGGLDNDEPDDPDDSRSQEILEWRTEDQNRLLQTFTWSKAPSTTQVRLAQEELWVYGLLCDAIKRMNEGATALFDSRITTVEQLVVGYPAAEEQPGGQRSGRVLTVQPPAGTAPGGLEAGLPPTDGSMEMAGGMPGMPQGRPLNPRFASGPDDAQPMGMGPGGGELGEGQAAALSPDDMLKQWIYVDFTGRPLTAPELGTSPDARFVHLVPFVLRVVMDQRQIDRLLADLAGASVPIDVRQVRINPSASGAGEMGGAPRGAVMPMAAGFGGPDAGGPQGRRRPFDVTVELRGTVGLATPPNPDALGPAATDTAAMNDGGGS
ncbi:MAG: hypothetical protein ACKOCX_04810 [Planctomycetota bacterium]